MVRMRMTRSKTGNRRANRSTAVHPVQLSKDGSVVMRHRACPHTGTYRGRTLPLRSAVRAQKRATQAEQRAEQKQAKETNTEQQKQVHMKKTDSSASVFDTAPTDATASNSQSEKKEKGDI